MSHKNFKFLTHEEFHLLSQTEKVRYIALAMDALVDWSAGLPGDSVEKLKRGNGPP
jgi:hypothetical protein